MSVGSYLLAHAQTIDRKERNRSTPIQGYVKAVLCVFLSEELYIGEEAEADVTHRKWNFTSLAMREQSVNEPLTLHIGAKC